VPTVPEDHEEIRLLFARYCFLLDRERDADAIVALFTPEGSWEGLGAGRKTGGALREFMTLAVTDPTVFRHFTLNEMIEVVGDRASARSYLLVLALDRETPRPFIAGFFEDELVRMEGQWRFASRRVVT
jgi:hypothetical protein